MGHGERADGDAVAYVNAGPAAHCDFGADGYTDAHGHGRTDGDLDAGTHGRADGDTGAGD